MNDEKLIAAVVEAATDAFVRLHAANYDGINVDLDDLDEDDKASALDEMCAALAAACRKLAEEVPSGIIRPGAEFIAEDIYRATANLFDAAGQTERTP